MVTEEAGAGGCHGARPGLRERVAGRRENLASKFSEVGCEEGGPKAYEVAGESSGVGGKEGGRKAYGVAENPQGDRQGVQGGVELPQDIGTLKVEEFSRGERNLRSGHQG